MARLGRGAFERMDCAACLEQVDSILRPPTSAQASLPLVALCDLAVDQLSGTTYQRWSLVIAMMIGDGLFGVAG
jgi:hypothetical protein